MDTVALTGTLIISVAVVGYMEAIKAVFAHDYRTVSIIVGAAVIGLGIGTTGYAGIDPFSGFVAGLSAAGIVKVGKEIGGN